MLIEYSRHSTDGPTALDQGMKFLLRP
jgi:hypothetical protein